MPQREDRPPEHSSPEAMLKWARAQRLNQKLPKESAASHKKAQKEFVSLAFAAPVAAGVHLVAESAENAAFAPDSAAIVPSRSASNRSRFLGPTGAVLAVLLALVVIWSGMNGSQTLPSVQPETRIDPNAALDPFASNSSNGEAAMLQLVAADALQTNFLVPNLLVPPTPGPILPLANVVLMSEPEVATDQAQTLRLAVLLQSSFAVSDSVVSVVFVPTVGVRQAIADMPTLAASRSDHESFVPPVQYSRSDLGVGAASLLGLMTGQDSVQHSNAAPPDTAVVKIKPLIYVHHGLGVSPETVRKVMQVLSSSGYESVFQVGVPFRIGRTNVRFYHASDGNLAQAIAGTVIPLVQGPQFSQPRDFSRFSKPPRPGTIDIWLSDKA